MGALLVLLANLFVCLSNDICTRRLLVNEGEVPDLTKVYNLYVKNIHYTSIRL